MKEKWFEILIAIGLFIVVGVVIWAAGVEGDREVRQWAADHGYTVVSVEAQAFKLGPFNYRSKGQRVYRAVLRDAHGRDRVAWFRTGWTLEQAWDEVEGGG